MNLDHANALQSGQQSKTQPQAEKKEKEKKKSHYQQNRISYILGIFYDIPGFSLFEMKTQNHRN